MGKLAEAEWPLLEPKILSRHDPAGQSRSLLGTIWDHTLCAVMNDLRVYERLARPYPATQGERVSTIYRGSKWFALQR